MPHLKMQPKSLRSEQSVSAGSVSRKFSCRQPLRLPKYLLILRAHASSTWMAASARCPVYTGIHSFPVAPL